MMLKKLISVTVISLSFFNASHAMDKKPKRKKHETELSTLTTVYLPIESDSSYQGEWQNLEQMKIEKPKQYYNTAPRQNGATAKRKTSTPKQDLCQLMLSYLCCFKKNNR